MLSIFAALLLYPPVTVVDTAPAQEVAYEFAFAPEAGETRADRMDRLRAEANDYCRVAMRDAGVPNEAKRCTKRLVAEVRAELDTGVAFAAN